MKQIIKTHSKKGFTLLEVMLSVAILTIASTMIMNGFLATMKYSTNTSVYSRCGSYDYQTTITKLADYSSRDIPSRYREGAIARSGSNGTQQVISLDGLAAHVNTAFNTNGMYVVHWEEDLGGATNERNMFRITETSEQRGAVDDRHTFFYMPTNASSHNRYKCPNNHVGYIQPCHYLGGDHFVCLYSDDNGNCWAICDAAAVSPTPAPAGS